MAAYKLFICLLVAGCAAAFDTDTLMMIREKQDEFRQTLDAEVKTMTLKSDEPIDDTEKCPHPEDIKPCRCIQKGDNSLVIECSGTEVTQACIENTMARTRSANNLGPRDYLKLNTISINKTSLTSVNLTSLLYTETVNFLLDDNLNLTSITGPMMGWGCEELMGKIKVNWFSLLHSWSLNDDGFGNTLKMFDPSMSHLWITATDIRGGRYPLNDGSGDIEFLPGLAAFKDLKGLHHCYTPIREVSGGQFKRNHKLDYLDLYGNGLLTTIGYDAFYFDFYQSDFPMTIHFYGDVLTDDSFSNVEFTGLTKSTWPINLILQRNQIKTLTEANFRPFLDAHPKNTMNLAENQLQCNSKMRWLRANKQVYENQVLNARCANDNNKSIFESRRTL